MSVLDYYILYIWFLRFLSFCNYASEKTLISISCNTEFTYLQSRLLICSYPSTSKHSAVSKRSFHWDVPSLSPPHNRIHNHKDMQMLCTRRHPFQNDAVVFISIRLLECGNYKCRGLVNAAIQCLKKRECYLVNWRLVAFLGPLRINLRPEHLTEYIKPW